MSRKCVISREAFFYICGEFTLKSQRKAISPLVRKVHELYFGCNVGDQVKNWHHTLVAVRVLLIREIGWMNHGQRCHFLFQWLSRAKRSRYWLLFLSDKCVWVLCKSKKAIQYPTLPSAMRPVQHNDCLPVPRSPTVWTLDDDDDTVGASGHHVDVECDSENDPDFQPVEQCQPLVITQPELNDLVRDLNLSKSQTELLVPGFRHLLAAGTKISMFCSRHDDRVRFFHKDDAPCFCTDVNG